MSYSIGKHRSDSLTLSPNAALDRLAALGQDADLTFHLVHADANMFHGWPPPLRHNDRVLHCGGFGQSAGGGQPLHPIYRRAAAVERRVAAWMGGAQDDLFPRFALSRFAEGRLEKETFIIP